MNRNAQLSMLTENQHVRWGSFHPQRLVARENVTEKSRSEDYRQLRTPIMTSETAQPRDWLVLETTRTP